MFVGGSEGAKSGTPLSKALRQQCGEEPAVPAGFLFNVLTQICHSGWASSRMIGAPANR